MPTWTIFIGIAAFVVPLSERFYTRFYPEPETQKRHLKTAARWIIDSTSVIASVWVLISIFREPMPSTGQQVASIAFKASLGVGALMFIASAHLLRALLYVVREHIQVSKKQEEYISDLLDTVAAHERALSGIVMSIAFTEEQRAIVATAFLDSNKDQRHNASGQ
ncbi:hypothetical protein [Edaphobacter dinghuensis]|uniref:hypothetical protein n=1 Tax=Edaphobacter dinghuensis TaxID=1560005 RepID=UPI00166B9383|nr:hypothetical protein [Edaphobacter dinghuensis]